MHFSTLVESRSLIYILIFGLWRSRVVSAFTQCYYPDGSIPTDYVWVPCTGAQYSSCCVPSEGDVCQPDGLCYYPEEDMLYRGTCTDRTFNDPSCNADICVTGFETTWSWVLQCDAGGSDSYVCGEYYPNGNHATPTCALNAAAQTSGFVTTTSTSSVARYTPPASVNTNEFTVMTSSYTIIISASAQSTTLTSDFASTFTSKIGEAAVTASSTSGVTVSISGSNSSSKGAVTLGIGALIGIIIGAILLLSLGLGALVILRNKHLKKKEEAIRLNSATDFPPPNGPVGRDQIYPYEAPSNEVSALPKKYTYMAPKVDTYEIDDPSAAMRGEKTAAVGLRNEYEEQLRSPAPTYSEALMPVELDSTPSLRGANGGYGRV